ncbi:NUDIX domain-containing protein [Kineosporia sp. J2-2]|uniref:NUDIX domain-containing protein n=1 Tax=Kineosporia corallincola TaxID=2835133 RepID=A0ABS5TA34_9ACTN|nr:NUDIX domain-containing protein [Kineosporia corallincola]MBT0767916.1 NUDIX domain-containing protein [Kineosporia corallincola]
MPSADSVPPPAQTPQQQPSVPPAAQELRPIQRTTAYGVVSDGSGGVLVLRVPGGRDPRGRWSLPGGVVRHGEHPRDRVRAGLLEQTGLRAATITPRDAGADVVELPEYGVSVHTLRLLFDVTLHGRPSGIGGPDHPEMPDTEALAHHPDPAQPDRLPGEDPAVLPVPGDGPDVAAPIAVVLPGDDRAQRPVAQFVGRFMAGEELARLHLPPFLAGALVAVQQNLEDDEELPASRTAAPVVSGGPDLLDPPMDLAAVAALPEAAAGTGPEVPVFVQRPAAYAVLIDEKHPDGPRMLLSLLSGSESTWTLPGGGIDHGEHPRLALRREIHEEAGLPYTAGPLIDISSRHFVGRSPHLGRLEDFHAVRLIYAGSVPVDQEPQVIEVDGSTEAAAWLPVDGLDAAGAVPTAHDALAAWRAHRAGTPGEALIDAAADARGDEMMRRDAEGNVGDPGV